MANSTTHLDTVKLNGATGKTFHIDAIENERGRCLRVVEVVNGRRNSVMIPEEDVEVVLGALASMAEGYFLRS